MSDTYSLVCPETKQKLWIGQGWERKDGMTVFYGGMPDVMARLGRFLNATKGKALMVVFDELHPSHHDDDWTEFEDPDP